MKTVLVLVGDQRDVQNVLYEHAMLCVEGGNGKCPGNIHEDVSGNVGGADERE